MIAANNPSPGETTAMLESGGEPGLLLKRNELHFIAWHFRKTSFPPGTNRLDDPLLRARDKVPPDVSRTIERIASDQEQSGSDLGAEDGPRTGSKNGKCAWQKSFWAASKLTFGNVGGALGVASWKKKLCSRFEHPVHEEQRR